MKRLVSLCLGVEGRRYAGGGGLVGSWGRQVMGEHGMTRSGWRAGRGYRFRDRGRLREREVERE